jgi:hypothetical protein
LRLETDSAFAPRLACRNRFSVYTRPAASVIDGLLFHVIDYQDRYRALLHLQFEAELFGQGVEK